MHLKFLGGAGTVTGSKYLLTIGKQNILIDCGLFQGGRDLRERNWADFPIDPKSIDAVVITHAHIDHTGYIPLLVKNGYKGTIFATHATYDLCKVLLPDSARLQEEDAFHANKYQWSRHAQALPLYTEVDAIAALHQFKTVEFDKPYQILEKDTVTWRGAGHILGAAFIEFNVDGKKIIFSGDIGRPNDPIMKAPEALTEADYIVMESTYGDRIHDSADPKDKLGEIINRTIERGGTIIIPAFAVGRAQTLLYLICQLKSEGKIPNIPVFLDSPMAIDATELMCAHKELHKLEHGLCADVCVIAKYTTAVEQSKALDFDPMPKIIISASGMLEGGRVLHHVKTYAPDAKNMILLTGFQAHGTRGSRLLNGETELKIHGEDVPVRAEVQELTNLSAHADYPELLDWIKTIKTPPKMIFITHGEKDSAQALKKHIEHELKFKCHVPDYLEEVQL